SIATNILMLGYAAQKGLLPVSIASIEEAIRLNGTFIDSNLRTFALGRLAAHAPDTLTTLFTTKATSSCPDTLEALLKSRETLLDAYQNKEYASTYLEFVGEIERSVTQANIKGGELLVREVALTLSRLMTYKDEYEVARLHADPAFWQRLRDQFTGDFKVTF